MPPRAHTTSDEGEDAGPPAPHDLLLGSLAASGIGAVVCDAAGVVIAANEPVRALAAGLGHDVPVGRPLADLIADAEGEAPEGGADARRREAGCLVALRPAGDRFFRRIDAPWGGARAPAGSTLHLLIECTRELLSDRERRQREVYLARAADDSMDAILSLDTEGRIRYWNRGAQRMFGYAASDVLGHPYELLVPEQMKREGELERIAEIIERQGVLRNFETVRLASGGRPIQVDITVTRLADASGANLGRSVIYRDISLRRRLETQLRENLSRLEALKAELSRKVGELRAAYQTQRENQGRLIAMEKLSAVGEMAAKMAHEIRTPLVTIGGFSHTVWKSLPTDAPQREYLAIIREEVRRLERFVSEILEYVKPGSIETEPSDINALVEESLRPHHETMMSSGIVLQTALRPGLPAVRVNRHQIHQVLTNLVVNALQSMEGAATRRLTVTTEAGENHVKVSIGDTGHGISPEHRERIFQPFFTTRPAGSGLGLAIAAQIAAQHHATLTLESEEGAGTTFHLRLPCMTASALGKETGENENDPRGG